MFIRSPTEVHKGYSAKEAKKSRETKHQRHLMENHFKNDTMEECYDIITSESESKESYSRKSDDSRQPKEIRKPKRNNNPNGRPKKKPHHLKGNRSKITCSSCGLLGHAKTSLSCPLNPRNPLYNKHGNSKKKTVVVKENSESP